MSVAASPFIYYYVIYVSREILMKGTKKPHMFVFVYVCSVCVCQYVCVLYMYEYVVIVQYGILCGR